ncbi:sensor histidine kinase [Janibacter sp. HTCC2649]|uniref:sensor histidine kinase n=1 Tax=Janibacter sp. HTCC2649 TaxID=313589 RepID=UPI0013050BF1|nr:histidine kinase [Janibacter sp. HTCC2649]
MVGGRVIGASGRAVRRLMRPLWRPLWHGLRWVAGHNDAVLGLLALVMFIIGWSTISLTHDVPVSLLPVLALAEAVPLVLLRRAPFVGWAIAAAVSVLWWAVVPAFFDSPMPWPVVQFLVLLATIVAVGLWGRWREIPVVIIATGVLLVVAMPDDLKPWALGQALVMGVALLVRWLVISRRQLAVQKDEVETERARRAVVEERSRIARELHDVVAHHMSMIVVQAQSAPIRHGVTDPEVVAEFSAIEGSARQALTEVRSVLGVLRDERGPVKTAPLPDLTQLPALVKASKAAGMPLTSRLRLDPTQVPPGTALVLYRVAQESLANAARHAPGAAVELTLEEDSGWARLMVRNSPPPTHNVRAVGREPDHPRGRNGEGAGTGGDDEGGGNGIPGMFERVRAVGGTFEAEPVGAGFVVIATVPLTGRPQVSGLG